MALILQSAASRPRQFVQAGRPCIEFKVEKVKVKQQPAAFRIAYSTLEQQLEVKQHHLVQEECDIDIDEEQLYMEKFGDNMTLGDEEVEKHADFRTMMYSGVEGYSAAPHIRCAFLEQKFDEVKQLYAEKVGGDFDADDEELAQHAEFRAMQYGGVVGYVAGPRIAVSSMEPKLGQVQQLYAEFDGDLEAEKEEEEEHADFRTMKDAATEGYIAGPCIIVSSLERNSSYIEKFGDDVDADSEEVEEHANYRAIQFGAREGYAVGPIIAVLVQELDEVKRHYGDSDIRAMQYGGADGYAAVPIVTISSVRELDEVKQLNVDKFDENSSAANSASSSISSATLTSVPNQ
mmetsp:Transcript_15856/g.37405  ORF Transcript_15856/g.37405 Transcript_15856/m.37405 type:complete len:347 (-) Transcript_15856:601-1641(-)|eukprot:CAMPEP_0178411122 /NCGR_PEP_ID=MMETSP0689_2-20121128/21333_1 /TAXON_ID=160604 /ORGANISM="Amphidinium massartii, Strain CS-259" /LENGTH=346 /DNA_ID=CAMNT_0020032321 /DNA_START=95 /DNA_END=1135 /DNA_ORIENTATION=+